MKLTPRNAKTFNKICKLKQGAVDWHNFWMLIEEKVVYIHEQKRGEATTQDLKIPRATFERFIDWYNDGQWPRKREQK